MYKGVGHIAVYLIIFISGENKLPPFVFFPDKLNLEIEKTKDLLIVKEKECNNFEDKLTQTSKKSDLFFTNLGLFENGNGTSYHIALLITS